MRDENAADRDRLQAIQTMLAVTGYRSSMLPRYVSNSVLAGYKSSMVDAAEPVLNAD